MQRHKSMGIALINERIAHFNKRAQNYTIDYEIVDKQQQHIGKGTRVIMNLHKNVQNNNLLTVSIPNPPYYRLKKNGLGVTSLSKSVLSLFDLVLWEQFFPVYWSLQGRYFFECGSQPCVRIHTGLQAASQQRIKYAVVLCTAVIA